MYAPRITQRCLSWSAVSLGLPPLPSLPSLPRVRPFLPSPRVSIQQPSLPPPHLAARWPLVPLTKPITHAGPLVMQRQNWLFCGLWAPQVQGPHPVSLCF